MSRQNRFLIAAVIAALLFGGIALIVRAGAPARAPADTAPAATTAVHLLAGQKPRIQEISAGDNAAFTVSITNTGTVVLENVAVTNATTPSCNRIEVGPLAAGQSTSYTCQRDDVEASFLNDLTVTGTAGGSSATYDSNAFVQVQSPDLRIIKNPTTQVVRPGATAFFSISVLNTSTDVTLTNIHVDDNLIDSCDLDPGVSINLSPGEDIDYNCSQANVQLPLTTIATTSGTNPENDEVLFAADVAWVEILNLTAAISAQPTSVVEPGAPVTFTINLVNSGSVPATLIELTTNQFGNLLNPGNSLVDPVHNTCLPQASLPMIPPHGGSFRCSFLALVSGQPSSFSVILNATVRDATNKTVTATTNTTVAITSIAPTLDLTLGANPPIINPPSRTVNFSVRVDNTSDADTVNITKIEDSLLGSLHGRGTCNLPVINLQPGDFYACQFSAVVSGQTGQTRTRTITVTAVSDDINPETVIVSDDVTVGITDEPTQEIFLPNITDDVVGSSCVDAYPLNLNRRYQFFPPNQGSQSVFRFTLPRSGNVRVELTNFAPRQGQLVVWMGNCGALELIGRNPDDGLNKTVDLGTRAALDGEGDRIQYIIQLINDGPSNNRDLYSLFIRFN